MWVFEKGEKNVTFAYDHRRNAAMLKHTSFDLFVFNDFLIHMIDVLHNKHFPAKNVHFEQQRN